MTLDDASILVTGGTGSFGNRFAEAVLARHRPRRLIVFSRDELKQSEMQLRLRHPALRFFLGDVRDRDRLRRAMHDVDLVVHAAALKQIPACEYNPFEAIQTNVMGAKNVIEAAIDSGVKRVIALSTDKACVDYHARVELADGSTRAIHRLVKEKDAARVLTVWGDRISSAPVVGWYKNKRLGRSMVGVSYVGGPRHGRHARRVWVTDDHLVLTTGGWKAAGKLTSDDLLVTSEASPNPEQMALVAGTLLGDSTVVRTRARHSRYRLKLGHAADQQEWLRLKLKALTGFRFTESGGSARRGRQPFIQARSEGLACFSELAKLFYDSTGRKRVPRALVSGCLARREDIFLAAWFLDDGCQVRNVAGRASQARIATHGFGRDDVTWLSELLTSKGYECYPYRAFVGGKEYWELRFRTAGARRLFASIAQSVPPSMRHKIPANLPEFAASSWDLGETTPHAARATVRRDGAPRSRDVYCLDIEETHNFAVGGVVLHNCQPVNLYGATKLCAEKLFVQANTYGFPRGTMFSCVRYGNVIGSRGSVIPLFREQSASGTVTVTDPKMTRFWITLDQGVEFVTRCLGLMHGGEIFVPKLPSTRIMDLVEAVAPGCHATFVGIRPGEKLHEVLISEDEARQAIEHDTLYVVEPLHPSWAYRPWTEGTRLPAGSAYTSFTNDHFLTPDEMRRLIDG
jgi:nucleoside-diphosphate-sugar epimerase